MLFYVAGIATVLLSLRAEAVREAGSGEYFGLLLGSITGMVVLAAGREPDHAVRRPRAAVDPALRALRERGAARHLARGRAQVPGDRLGRLGHAALRAGAHLRRHRPDRLRRDRRRDRRHRLAQRPAAADRHRARGHRPRLQGVGRAVPPVDARRLPGRPDPDHHLHGGGHQGRGVRGHAALLRPRAGRHPARLGAGARRAGGGHDRDRQRRRDPAALAQADARLVGRGPGRLPAGGRGGRHPARPPGDRLLPRRLPADERRRLRRGDRPRAGLGARRRHRLAARPRRGPARCSPGR